MLIRAFTHTCQSLWAFSAELQREREISPRVESEELLQARVLDSQPHLHHPHEELGEMHRTELKLKALHVTYSNSLKTDGTSSPLNLIQDSELRPKFLFCSCVLLFWFFNTCVSDLKKGINKHHDYIQRQIKHCN